MKPFALPAAALAASFLTAIAIAQTPPALVHKPSALPAGAYTVEPGHTRIVFSVNHLGFTTYYGDLTGAKGRLDLDPRHPAASKVTVAIPTASISTTNGMLDGELKGGDWLDADTDPTITFVSTRVTLTGPTTAKIAGDLTLHGVTLPVVLDAKFNAGGVNPLDKHFTIGFDATTHISRSAFGVKKYVPLVGDRVDVLISAAFEKAN